MKDEFLVYKRECRIEKKLFLNQAFCVLANYYLVFNQRQSLQPKTNSNKMNSETTELQEENEKLKMVINSLEKECEQ